MLAAALLQLGFAELHGDVSWLLIVADRVLNGETLYRDVYEINPPLSVALYLPWMGLEHLTGIRAEVFTTLAVFAVLAVSMMLVLGILRRTAWLDGSVRPALFTVAALLFFAPTSVFAQREHWGMIAFLPCLTLIAARAVRGPRLEMPLGLVIASGVLGAAIVCLKPYYVLAILLPVLISAARHRSLRILFAVENLAAAAVVVAYGLIVWKFFPAYAENVLPIALDLYGTNWTDAGRASLEGLKVTGFAFAAVAVICWRTRFDPVVTSGFAASTGFLAVFLAQGKGWDYHLLPVVVTVGLTLAIAWRQAPRRDGALGIGRILALCACVSFAQWSADRIRNGTQYVFELASLDNLPPDATLLTFTQHLKLVHPAARHIRARWIARDGSDWIAGLALKGLRTLPEGAPQAKTLRRRLAEVIDQKAAELATKPDLVVTVPEDDAAAAFLADPRIAAAMRDYRHVMTIGPVIYHMRVDRALNHPSR
ncbi:hypothetical protein [Oricola sp.]|uniref:hypothetical protein n=1 Tax=Oricola sp. TaxID=1979950 RepID=UPI0025D02A95|nr:hypothetical protein [Oricola sp.]MCI5077555.1 hypothetical protein [Oricola sp.]